MENELDEEDNGILKNDMKKKESAKAKDDETVMVNEAKKEEKRFNADEELELSRLYRCLVRDEDLRQLLLHYMKVTFESRKRNPDLGEERSRDSDDCFPGTDCDSEDADSVRVKSIFSPGTFKCDHCSKILQGIYSLRNHIKRKHESDRDGKKILCDKCPTRFYTDFEFNRHYQTHYSVKNHLCHLCPKEFVQKSTLDLHLRYHENDRRYQCVACRKKFFTGNHLKRHLLTHTNQRDFKCEPCNRSFRYRDHLRRHLRSVHIGVRCHCCRDCQKSFMYLSQLKLHQKSHAGEKKNYKCISEREFLSDSTRDEANDDGREKSKKEKFGPVDCALIN